MEADMQPVYFDGCAGWLHLPPEGTPQRSIGVILCAALGRDARCTYRPLKLFADQLSAAGYPTLRYDHLGLGDSADLPPDADALGLWIDGLKAARRLLRARTKVQALALGGVRFGATLAALGAERDDLLLLLAPVIEGRSWMAKLRFAAMQRGNAETREDPADGYFDADGVWLSATSAKSLSALDLRKQEIAAARIIVAANGRLTDGLEQHLADQGRAVKRIPFPGLADLFLDPNSNVAPQMLFEAVICELAAAAPPLGERIDDPALALAPPIQASLNLPFGQERVVTFAEGLQGVLCKPDAPGDTRRGVIFLNTGGDPRSGVGRFATAASRDLARTGVTALRFDFAGIGDSAAPPGAAPVHVYETSREADIRAALDLLKAEGVKQVFVVGISAGGYHALEAVIRERQIQGAFIISALKLIWTPGDSLAIGARRWGKATQGYLDLATQSGTWMRLVRGEIKVRAVTKTLAARLATRLTPRRTAPQSQALLKAIGGVAHRGARIRFLMGVEDASIDELEDHFGPKGRRFSRLPGMDIQIAPKLDHGLVYALSRKTALTALHGWIEGRSDAAAL